MISFNNLGRMGRLGNQMFQYASLKGIARNKGYNFCIPYSYEVNEWTDHQLTKYFKLDDNLLVKSHDPRHTRSECGYHFDQDLYDNCEDGTDINGYLQTEKYFMSIRDEILDDFSFKSEYELPMNKEYTSLHVRRGDYVNQTNHHPLCSVDYYLQALELVDGPIVVLSDDPEWCKQNIPADVYIENTSNIHDLFIMTKAKNNIIANSSFSWWGAWLNNNPEKKVICPEKWFGPGYSHYIMNDIRPPEWIQL